MDNNTNSILIRNVSDKKTKIVRKKNKKDKTSKTNKKEKAGKIIKASNGLKLNLELKIKEIRSESNSEDSESRTPIKSSVDKVFNHVSSIHHNYDTYIIFMCSDHLNKINRIENLLDIKIPDKVKEDSDSKDNEFKNFFIGKKNVFLVGFKDNNSCKKSYAYDVAGEIGMKINNTKNKYLVILNHQPEYISSIMSGLMQGFYNFTKYNNAKEDVPTIDFYYDHAEHDLNPSNSVKKDKSSHKSSHKSSIVKTIQENIIINQNQFEIRDLVNEPLNKLNSLTYLERIKKSFSSSNIKNVKISVLDESELKKKGLGLILAVNKGSLSPAMLIVIEYNNAPTNVKPICLVGKGVMFDTGGLNIKMDEFYDMKQDMAGSAIVFETIKTLSELNVKKNVVGILPIVQNDVSGMSTHPGDIVKSYSGKSVEIRNTDAEGRLILADGIAYCKNYNPEIIIDIATLTGQVEEIFGGMATALLGNDDKIIERIKECGETENEKMWQLPIWEENIKDTESTIADFKNISDNDSATINGAAFLSNFLPKKSIKWVHMDNAGVSYNLEDTSSRFSGATGDTFRTLVKFIRTY
jgi:leucyl aminopeptidase